MIKIDVINEVRGKTYGAKMAPEEAAVWIAKCSSNGAWGKPERNLLKEDLAEELLDRVISEFPVTSVVGMTDAIEGVEAVLYVAAVEASEGVEAVEEVLAVEAVEAVESSEIIQSIDWVTVKADYVITQKNLNLSKTYRNEQKILDRKAEYPSMEELLHVLMDKGMDSPEMQVIQGKRAATKLKFPLEK